MLGNTRIHLTLALLAGATAATVGCGGGAATTGSGGSAAESSSSSASSASSTSNGGPGPDRSSSGGLELVCPFKNQVLAVNSLDFGEGNSGQWKSIGFNLDGLVTTAASTNVCQPAAGASTLIPYPDGNDGIDNSFGKNLLPDILGIDPTWTTDVNNSILAGKFTALLELECLPPTGDVPVLTTKLFAGTTLSSPPKFDGTDKWPVEPDLLSNPKDPQSSTIVFNTCSVTGTAFDAGKNGVIVLTIPITTQGQSTSLKLTLYAARLTMTLSADRKSATGGMLGGVLNTAEFLVQVNKVGYLLDLCSNSLLATLLNDIQQASDILSDGTQDPTKTCDGISMGLGFTMAPAQIGGVGPAAPMGMTCN
jgi:hypothetical protein